MRTNKFKNKVCWITGASSGIGEALAIALSRQDAFLILSARSCQNLEKVKALCARPERVNILCGDMEDLQNLPHMARKSWEQFGRIDYVFLNAGFAVRDLVLNTSLEIFQKEMNINFFSTVLISKTLLPLMKEKRSGHFVVTSSLSGKYGVPKLSAYSASKHALHGYFESLRAEHEKDGIHVTIITAGLVRTGITLHALKGNGEAYARMEESVARGISPARCASEIILATIKNKYEALVGGADKYSVWLKRFFPRLLDYAIRNHPLRRLRSIERLLRFSNIPPK
jgi:dehydrogenase/reductase SDR family member 7B